MAARFGALVRSLTLVSILVRACADCSPDSCSSCSEDLCNPGNGCYDNSPGDFDASFCLACEEDRCSSGGEGGNTIDASLGCSGEDNVIVSLILGVMAGAFMCLAPCCFLSTRAQERWTMTFLDETNPTVRRAEAIIKDKQSHKGGGENSSSTSYTMVVAFTAQGDGAQTFPVRAQVSVGDAFWARSAIGSATEVAYSVKNPKDFLIVDNALESKLGNKGVKLCLMCALGLFAFVGLAMGAGTVLLTGCAVGLIPLALLLVGGCLWGQFACVPFARMIATSSFYVNTSGGEAASEKSVVMNGQSGAGKQ